MILIYFNKFIHFFIQETYNYVKFNFNILIKIINKYLIHNQLYKYFHYHYILINFLILIINNIIQHIFHY